METVSQSSGTVAVLATKGMGNGNFLYVAAVLSRLPGYPVLLVFHKAGHCFLSMLPLPLSSL